MIDLYMWPTGNGRKIAIMLEECQLPYRAIPVNIGKGDQHTAEFRRLNPNSKMPVIIDHDLSPALVIFESGAILQYLAEKTGSFLPTEIPARYRVLQWLNWQMGGFGPMAGQAHYFLRYASEKVPHAMERFHKEVSRLYGVLNTALEGREFIAGDYSIADMAIWPWVSRHNWQEQNLDDYPDVRRWYDTIAVRPAVERALTVGSDWADCSRQMSDEERKRLFSLEKQEG